MKVLLLAGGRSNRMSPIKDKALLPVCGTTPLIHQLETLKEAGFVDVTIVAQANNIDAIKAIHIEGLILDFALQTDETGGMKAAILSAEDQISNAEEVLIVSSNDIVELSLWRQLHQLSGQFPEADGFIVGYEVSEYFPGGYLEIDENHALKSIKEKPGAGNEPSSLVNLVFHLHRNIPALIKELSQQSNADDDGYEQALQRLIDSGKQYGVIPYTGFWQALKYPWDLLSYLDYRLKFQQRRIAHNVQIAPTAVINGPVVIDEGAIVYDHAVINGPAYIGPRCRVGNFSLVRQSSIGADCVVGSFTEVARTIVQSGVWTHKNYIGDSIIGNNVSFGSGTVTANLRLDEGEIKMNIKQGKMGSKRNKLGIITGDNIRVGVNTCFMPGIKIGQNTAIGAGLSISQDIPSNSFVVSSQNSSGLDIRKNTKKIKRR